MKQLYYVANFVLALMSITLALLDIGDVINIKVGMPAIINRDILLFFWVDYIARLTLAVDKKDFVKGNVFDLLAIIPVDSLFSVFRIARTVRLLKLLKVVRIFGLTGKIKNDVVRFLKTNGFIYMVLSAIAIILIGAGMYSAVEGINYGNALWWAVTTTTTVGYGDISPHSTVGKVIATVLMFVGIGLIGSVTSTLTTFFTIKDEKSEVEMVENRLLAIEQQVKELTTILREKG
ncbi:potassium channel family protein [Fructobacillus cardui]|uniref:potassium channel family protein n=1 Tax=Fructobacillus cardui TaxID=2893170 RepID=UPI002597E8BA|nr:potassium channel family protein [uncultured Fructobacillus sp.]CAK1226350.1 Voltage-gated potassium channel Kch (Kch) [Fructobacillus cardui]CAK1233507.1 Voltage-gated potassium channel Kch (Kch) [Fructobacillus cardui]